MGGVLKKLFGVGLLLVVVVQLGRNPATQGVVIRPVAGQAAYSFGRDTPADAVRAAWEARAAGDERGVISILDPAVKVNPFTPLDQFTSVIRIVSFGFIDPGLVITTQNYRELDRQRSWAAVQADGRMEVFSYLAPLTGYQVAHQVEGKWFLSTDELCEAERGGCPLAIAAAARNMPWLSLGMSDVYAGDAARVLLPDTSKAREGSKLVAAAVSFANSSSGWEWFLLKDSTWSFVAAGKAYPADLRVSGGSRSSDAMIVLPPRSTARALVSGEIPSSLDVDALDVLYRVGSAPRLLTHVEPGTDAGGSLFPSNADAEQVIASAGPPSCLPPTNPSIWFTPSGDRTITATLTLKNETASRIYASDIARATVEVYDARGFYSVGVSTYGGGPISNRPSFEPTYIAPGESASMTFTVVPPRTPFGDPQAPYLVNVRPFVDLGTSIPCENWWGRWFVAR